MNAYEPLLVDTDAGPRCRDCMQWCYFGTPAPPCDVDGCGCEPCERARRAVAADDRPDEQLASIARDIEHEARPEPAELAAERHPDHRELIAERNRRTA